MKAGGEHPTQHTTASSANVNWLHRLSYARQLLVMNFTSGPDIRSFETILNDLEKYRSVAEQFCGKRLEQLRVLEIGHGQRPFRALMLQALGVNVTGVDLDQLTFGFRDVLSAARHNGWYRAFKSLVRLCIFDRRVYSTFSTFVKSRLGKNLLVDKSRFVQSDVSNTSFWESLNGNVDFIYSEDVFEHIAPDRLPIVVELMANNLSAHGIALIRPMVFTGISGGHQIDWYSHTLEQRKSNRSSQPWDHLLNNHSPADTYLNRLTRKQFADLFAVRFDVVLDEAVAPDLGRAFLTPELRERLSGYDDYELFSNRVTFLLRPKKRL